MAISVEECAAEGLPTRPDPEPFAEHAVIDFTGLTDKESRTKSKKLQAEAATRGWIFLAPTTP